MTTGVAADELTDLRAAAVDLLGRRAPVQRVTALFDAGDRDLTLIQEMGGLGWMGPDLLVQHLAVLAEELGYALAPVPWLGTVMSAGVLPEDDPLHAEVEAGRAILALAWSEPGRAAALGDLGGRPASRRLPARSAERGMNVTDADVATHVVVLGLQNNAPIAWVVDRAELELLPLHGIDRARTMSVTRLDHARGRTIPPARGPAFLEARLAALLAAEHVGVIRRLLDMGVAHASSRVQFDRPIGSFEGVSHQLARVYTDLEACRSLAGRLAVLADGAAIGSAELAFAQAGGATCQQAAVHAAEVVLQVHGGMGMTWDHPLHWWYRRAVQNQNLLLSPSKALDRTAGQLLTTIRAGARI